MKKLTTLFIVAILGPSLVLAWLATRSLKDQEMVMRDQVQRRAENMTATVSQDVTVFMDDVRLFYRQQVDALVKDNRDNAETIWLQGFDQSICSRWGQVKAGCVIGDNGTVFHPETNSQDLRVQTFLKDNSTFFTNRTAWNVYRAPARQTNDVLAVNTGEPAKQKPFTVSGKSGVLDKVSVALSQAKKDNVLADDLDVKGKLGPLDAQKKQTTFAQSSVPADKKAANPQSAPKAKAAKESGRPQPSLSERKMQPAAKAAGAKKDSVGREMIAAPAAPSSSIAKNKQQQATLPQSSIGQLNVAPQYSKLRSQVKGKNTAENSKSGSFSVSNQMATQNERAKKAAPEAMKAEGQSEAAINQNAYPQTRRGIATEEKTQIPMPQNSIQADELMERTVGERQKMTSTQSLAVDHFAQLEADSVVMEEVIGEESEGALGRILDDGLHIYLWYRPQELNTKIFWVELDLNQIRSELQQIISGASFPDSEGFCLGLLDEGEKLVGKNREGFSSDWSDWLVKSEIGSILPRWMVTAYLVNPNELIQSARSLRLTILLLVVFLITAIGIGGWLIIKETGREMYLARQKTDFVSNVSHELKTPLTSIRMFSELLGNAESVEDVKRVEYAGIIDNETGRLTRLINQLLDFSRLERGGKRYDFVNLIASDLTRETVENYRHQLEADGSKLIFRDQTNGVKAMVKGDKDAISQIILNLLSNADKYGGSSPEIGVEVELLDEESLIEIRVKDRGKGISRRESTRIFEKFYRVDDSLASGIEGSGLGLSLAQQLAQAHGGNLIHRNRKNGGSCFVLSLPTTKGNES